MNKNSPDAGDDHSGNVNWEQLRYDLHNFIASRVNGSRLPAWRDQKPEIVEDITQEALLKLIDRLKSIERGESPPIDCIDGFSKVVAFHCFINAWRKDRYLFRFQSSSEETYGTGEPADEIDPEEVAIENLQNECILVKVALKIAKFPRKQKTALLIDLAWLCAFDNEVAILPCALLKQGIQLQDYRLQLPKDPVIRGRHAALLTLAYKRLATLYLDPALYSPVA